VGIFTTREIVLSIYITIIVIFVLARKKIRDGLAEVIRIALTPKLIIPFALILVCAAIIVYIFTRVSIWDWIYLKDVIVWVIFVGVPLCFNMASKGIEKYTFRNIVIDNLRLTAILEFFCSTFTFNFWVELLLQPVLAFFILMNTIAAKKDEYTPAKKVIDFILVIGGFILLYYTVLNAIDFFKNSETESEFVDIVVSFCLPIILSLLYLPFMYLFAVYARYESLFCVMASKEPKERRIRILHKVKVMASCGLSYNRVRKFQKEYACRMYTRMGSDDFDDLISDFRSSRRNK